MTVKLFIKLTFITTTGAEQEQFDFEFPEDVKLMQSVIEVGKKIGLDFDAIVLTPPGGTALTGSHYQMAVKDVTKLYGTTFTIINRGIVG